MVRLDCFQLRFSRANSKCLIEKQLYLKKEYKTNKNIVTR